MCVGPRSAVFAPVRRPRPDRDRRGARRLVQAGGRPALRRAPRGRAPRRARRAPCCWPAAPRRGPRACVRLRAADAARARGRPAAAAGRARGHGRRQRRPARAHAPGARRGPAPRREGDRAAEPPRLVELPLLPAVRPRLGVPALRRHARAAPRRRADRLPPLRPPRARAATCPDCGSVSVARHGAGTERLEARARGARSRRCPCSGSTPTSRAAAAPSSTCCARFERRRAGVLRRHADGGQGARLPRRHARAWCWTPTPRCASPTSAPRSARSRSSPSSPGAAAAASAAAG